MSLPTYLFKCQISLSNKILLFSVTGMRIAIPYVLGCADNENVNENARLALVLMLQ